MSAPVIPTLALTGVVVATGIIIDKKKISPRWVVGLAFLAITLAFLDNYSADLAGGLALLVLVAAVWAYAPGISKALGAIK